MNNIVLRATNGYSSAPLDIALHIGNSTSSPFVTVPVPYTGSDRCAFTTLNVDFDGFTSGVHDLYITFPSSAGGNLHLDWFVFNRTSHYIATEKMEAEDYSSQFHTTIYNDCSDTTVLYIGSLDTTSFIEYKLVDFGSGVEMVTLRVANQYTGGPLDIAMHLGSSTNTPFVTVPLGFTGSERCDFFILDAFLDTYPSGQQDLYLTFPSTEASGFLHLDWFLFNRTLSHQK